MIKPDSIISPLLMKGQSLHHICINNADEIMFDVHTLYKYVEKSIFTVRNIDMPRVVRMIRRKKIKDRFRNANKSQSYDEPY